MPVDQSFPDWHAVYSAAKAILDENRCLDIVPRDIALLLLIRHYLDSKDEVTFSITDLEIRHLSLRLDEMDARDLQASEKRHTDSLSRLIRAECLCRADMSRLTLAGDTEYQLTSLGESLALWYYEREYFSGEPLTAILRAFDGHLLAIVKNAEEPAIHLDPDRWRREIVNQIQVVLNDMLLNVQRHQRELDRQHNALREFIPTLLREQSEKTIDRCRAQLDTVIKTILDLRDVTFSTAGIAEQRLDKIADLGVQHGHHDVEGICDNIERRLEAIKHWTTERWKDWTEHHSHVHEYLRTVIAIDKNRRITEALKRAVADPPSWSLIVADELPLLRFRPDSKQHIHRRTAPRKTARSYSHQRKEIIRDHTLDILQGILSDMSESGEYSLAAVLREARVAGAREGRLVYHLPWLMKQLIRRGNIDKLRRPLISVSDSLEIEEMRIVR